MQLFGKHLNALKANLLYGKKHSFFTSEKLREFLCTEILQDFFVKKPEVFLMDRTHVDTKNPAFSFLLGAVMGGGDISRYRTRFWTSKNETAERFIKKCKTLKLTAKEQTRIMRKKKYRIICINSQLFSNTLKEEIKKKNYMNEQFMKGFLLARKFKIYKR